MTDADILSELGVDLAPKEDRARTPREERIIAGFEDIIKFRQEHGRAPEHGEGSEIFERIYAVRLGQLRALPESHELLAEMDRYNFLGGGSATAPAPLEDLDDSALLAELGVDDASTSEDITQLRNVRSNSERKAAEEIASAERCEDFAIFKPLFDRIEADLASGARVTRPFGRDAGIDQSDFFILRGQLAYVAEVGDLTKAPNGQNDARLRVIYSNGTESNLLRWSLQRALYKDESGRRVTEPDAGPLFDGAADDPDFLFTGTLYVLRSRSTHPKIAAHRDLIHKIGITGGSVESRIAGALDDATYLLAGVDVVATYKLFDVNRPRLERLIHHVLENVRFEVEIPDRFGKLVRPREWFLVPLSVIDEIVQRIADGTLVDYTYDRTHAALVNGTG
ncbi:GIY-YIG nuclease family protein [Sphingobium sp. BS19]|uniref:GIY-YIG nuclease family protein n=1 Tax=Sphingobium sp. BS19 TaxID=3018973 RepID=UPI002491539E|nr:GIY-YIG nuclease family protein [Sphingobium sp. BS19]